MRSPMYGLARPMLFSLPPEAAHCLTISALRIFGGLFGPRGQADPRLETQLFGLTFTTPVGIAAGFDKNAALGERLASLGAGFAEVGTVTPRPQLGNEKPRVFRLAEDEAVINRLGFNNIGADRFAHRLSRRRGRIPLAVNIGANRDSADRAGDYAYCVEKLSPFADLFVINVSSPNTPGLRRLQDADALDELLDRLSKVASEAAGPLPPLLLKVAPDLESGARRDIIALAIKHGVAGLVVSNTTLERPSSLRSRWRNQEGGLSGRPLFDLSTEGLRDFYGLAEGRLPLVGVGGISSAETAYRKIRAGASLVELYTGLIYRGPGLIRAINRELAAMLTKDGFDNVAQAVGRDA